MDTKVIKHSDDTDAKASARVAGKALRDGKLVGFATETVYGVGVVATDGDAIERLRELKSRPARPFGVHMADPHEIARYVTDVPAPARRLIDRAWPGPITLILPVGPTLPDVDLEAAGLHKVLCKDGTIGLRCPAAPVTQAALKAAGGPVVASSANLAGNPSPRTAKQVLRDIDGRIDLLVDSGPTRYGKDSTIVLFDGSRWKVVREGVCDRSTVADLVALNIVFVCTGNTCRSPIAEGLAKAVMSDYLGCRPGDLPEHGYRFSSAGVFGGGGGPTPEAVTAAKELGADIRSHVSRRMTGKLADQADILFCMSPTHVAALRRVSKSCADRAVLLDVDGAIPDPIGGGVGVYRQTARRIQRALQTRLKEELSR